MSTTKMSMTRAVKMHRYLGIYFTKKIQLKSREIVKTTIEGNKRTGNGNYGKLLKLVWKEFVKSHQPLFLADLSNLKPLCIGSWG